MCKLPYTLIVQVRNGVPQYGQPYHWSLADLAQPLLGGRCTHDFTLFKCAEYEVRNWRSER